MERDEAFRVQALSDLSVFDLLLAQDSGDVPRCHALHSLQMSFEKLSKALNLRLTNEAPKYTHRFQKQLFHAMKNRSVAILLGFSSVKDLSDKFDRLRTLVNEIEASHPQVAPDGGPNFEYPWRAHPNAEWEAPASSDHFNELIRRLRTPDGQQLVRLIRAILDRYESLP